MLCPLCEIDQPHRELDLQYSVVHCANCGDFGVTGGAAFILRARPPLRDQARKAIGECAADGLILMSFEADERGAEHAPRSSLRIRMIPRSSVPH